MSARQNARIAARRPWSRKKKPVIAAKSKRSRLELAQRLISLRRRPGKRLTRELLCAEYGVPNTGRQWRKLRKRLAREERAAQRGGR